MLPNVNSSGPQNRIWLIRTLSRSQPIACPPFKRGHKSAISVGYPPEQCLSPFTAAVSFEKPFPCNVCRTALASFPFQASFGSSPFSQPFQCLSNTFSILFQCLFNAIPSLTGPLLLPLSPTSTPDNQAVIRRFSKFCTKLPAQGVNGSVSTAKSIHEVPLKPPGDISPSKKCSSSLANTSPLGRPRR